MRSPALHVARPSCRKALTTSIALSEYPRCRVHVSSRARDLMGHELVPLLCLRSSSNTPARSGPVSVVCPAAFIFVHSG
eukprot:3438305-Rhodomonas_salina.5